MNNRRNTDGGYSGSVYIHLTWSAEASAEPHHSDTVEEVLHHKTKPVLFIRWPLNSVSALWTQIQFQSISSTLITLTSMTSFFFYLRLSTVCLCWGERSDSEVDLKVLFLLGAGILQETSDFSEKSQSERWDFWCYVQFAQQDGYVGVYT